ncbi:hypothetical protein MVEG_10635 [Podila verticillata NRRL 6337]|nr:hypothetical protein MVEG_10635 [Podila verticillata NRRL 6337]
MTHSRRHILGTAHIAFGPPTSSPSPAQTSHPHPHLRHPHDHHHPLHHHSNESNPHFWAIMPSPTTNSCFVLKGTPHPLGSYPPDIPEPHGCIPPHLYYATTVYEHTFDLSSSSSSSLHLSTTPKRTWTLPYVHRLGDGRDDAGGLTSAYHLLIDLEDADDFGAFIGQHVVKDEKEEEEQEEEDEEEEGESGEHEQDRKKEVAMMYACTNILVGEARVLNTIKSHFFEPWSKEQGPLPLTGLEIPQSLTQLKDIFATLAQASLDHPFSLCISELQLVLPEE